MKILIIEDHPKLREVAMKYFKLRWHTIEWVTHGKDALNLLKQYAFDAIILDVNLPVMDGREFLKQIRAQSNTTPVIAATSNSMLDHKLEMFDLWADDYIIKPFDFPELEARLKSLYKRKEKTIDEIIKIKDLEIDIQRHIILRKWKEIKLSNKEFMIVEFLAKNKGFPKSKMDILEYVWGIKEQDLNFDSITLEMHISKLRKKLGKEIITTLKWVWYVIT